MSLLDSQTVELACPHCARQMRETIGKLKTNPNLTCSHCAGVTTVDATDLRSKIASVDKALANLTRQLGRLGK